MTSKVFPQSNLPIRRTVDMLPAVFRTSTNKKFYAGTMDALTQPGTMEKTVGYVGRRFGKTFQSNDVYIDSSSKLRNAYQLEPAAVILDGKQISEFYDYLDFKAQQQNFGSIVGRDDYATAMLQYSWNPPIDWDKLVNYREYYWDDISPADYFVMEPGNSQNDWSVANKWVHRSQASVLTEERRAKRPIIEFNGSLELFGGQTKETINQPPLFDVFNADGISFGDTSFYPASTFRGSQLFGYDQGHGPDDSVLGFPIRYQTVNNTGDIVFRWFFDSQTFSYVQGRDTVIQEINTGFYKKDNEFDNGWIETNPEVTGSIIETVTVNSKATQVVFNTVKDWSLVSLYSIFKNGVQQTGAEIISFNNGVVEFNNALNPGDTVDLKLIADSEPQDGYYNIPVALERNPQNKDLITLTLGEATDHLRSAMEFVSNFEGVIPGESNTRLLSGYTANATRFIKHAGNAPLAMALLCDRDLNLIKSLQFANRSYTNFKNQFLKLAEEIEFDDNVPRFVDTIIKEFSKSKSSKNAFSNSDMIGSGAFTETVINVDDAEINTFALTEKFDLESPSNRAVYVYLNNEQLIYDVDYTFNSVFGYVKIIPGLLSIGDTILIREYVSTNVNFIPPTPTSMGLYKKYIPEIFVDDTYATSTPVIIGHDGSITVAFGDYRDQLLIELEQRIYNNIKIDYNPQLFNNDSVIGSYFAGEYSREQINAVISNIFLHWTQELGKSFSENVYVDTQNPFTFNYSKSLDPFETQLLPGSWRGIYLWLFDTIRPHTHPWEMLGFSVKPAWWGSEYGTNYSSANTVMWSDIQSGIIKQGPQAGVNERYARPGLLTFLPVSATGELLDPVSAGIAKRFSNAGITNAYRFGDVAPVEYAWRSSSEWPFAVMIALSILKPFKFISQSYNKLAYTLNSVDQLVSKSTLRFATISDILKTSSDAVGLSAYIKDYVKSKGQDVQIVSDKLSLLNVQLSTRLSGFVDVEKQKYVLDSKTPASSGVFVPAENYQIVLHNSVPIQSHTYSGIIVEKTQFGWVIRGYDLADPFFEIYEPNLSMPTTLISVGGISEEFSKWASSVNYSNGQIVEYRGDFYRSIRSHTSGTEFLLSNWSKLSKLPVSGASEATGYTKFKTDTVVRIPYGTEFLSLQEVIDVILGYEARLKEIGFVFDNYDSETQVALDWTTSCKELLFWSRQNWAAGALIALSPSATSIKFNTSQGSPESIIDNFNDYRVLDANSLAIPIELINVDREWDTVTISTVDNAGIYFAKISITLTEHVTIFSDKTVFNDVIYDQATGFRQERIKSRGFKTVDWNGSYFTPGFIYDEAVINDWQPFTDYKLGDMVRYRSRVYTSLMNQLATRDFEFANWEVVNEAPKADLIPNFDFRIKQIEEYFDPASETISSDLRSQALHTIGFQPREYLNELAEDSTTQLQLYQGFIRDKGTIQAISKVFGRLNNNTSKPGIEIKEDWAFRVGQLGGIDQIKEIEFEIEKSKISNSQNIVFSRQRPEVELLKRYVVPRNKFTLAPDPFRTDLVPVLAELPRMRVAGYVNVNDVTLGTKNVDTLLTESVKNLIDGNYIWITFEDQDWGIYRYTRSDFRVVSAEQVNNGVKLRLNRPVTFSNNELIAVNHPDLNGFFKVVEINSFNVVVEHNIIEDLDFSLSLPHVFVLEDSRFDKFDDTDPFKISKLPSGSKLWIDNSTAGGWKVVRKQQQYRDKPVVLSSTITADSQRSGNSTLFSEATNQAFVTVNSAKAGITNTDPQVLCIEVINNQAVVTSILTPDQATETQFGTSMSVSADGKHLVIQSANRVYTYTYNENTGVWGNKFVQVIADATGEISISSNGVDYFLAVSSLNNNEVKIYTLDNTLWVNPISVVVAESNFGSRVKFASNSEILIVSATDLSYRGRWSPNRAYLAGDVVVVENQIYRATVDTSEPPTDLVDWILDQEDQHIGKVYIYNFDGSTLTLLQQIVANDIDPEITGSDQFGFAVDISADANILVIGSPKTDATLRDQGAAYVFKRQNNDFELAQTIQTFETLLDENFGHSVSISQDSQTISVGAKNSGTRLDIFESEGTTFDFSSTFIVEYSDFFGSVYIFDKQGTQYFLTEKLEPTQHSLQQNESFGYSVSCSNRIVIAGSPDFVDEGASKGKFRVFVRDTDSSWVQTEAQAPLVDINKIQRVELVDNVQFIKIAEPDFIDAAKLKIHYLADQELAFKTAYDPAVYNFGDPTGLQTVDEHTAWAESNVGRLWWDISTAKWVYYEQSSDDYRAANWNRLAPGAEIDVYEWVETELLPSEWFEIAQTQDGISQGITGEPLHPTDNFYTVKTIKSSTGATLSQRYFYWVKNTANTPMIKGRRLPANVVASIIKNPELQRLPIVAFTGSRSIKAINFNSAMPSTTALLNFQLVNHQVNNPLFNNTLNAVHNEYQLITEGDPKSVPAPQLEAKWIDSLVGTDIAGNFIPDVSLPEDKRFGLNVRPRQSMFKNRFAALRLFIERANSILKSEPFSEFINLQNLTASDPVPVFDSSDNTVIVGTYIELSLIPQNQRGPDVLVLHDETADGLWSLYFYEASSDTYFRKKTQKFNTSRFWDYTDWWKEGFGPNSAIANEIVSISQVGTVNLDVGDLLRVKEYSSGNWAVFEKTSSTTGPFLENYQLVGRANGTIQIDTRLFNQKQLGVGYDVAAYDVVPYSLDISADLRNIIKAVKEDICTGNRKVDWNLLFFASVRYVFTEQQFVDWAFKTSFISATHNVGLLDQKINFKNDALDAYEQFVNEVKPYRTTVRDYRSVYSVLDSTDSMIITDFDSAAADPDFVRKMDITIKFDRVSVNRRFFVKDIEETFTYPANLNNGGFDLAFKSSTNASDHTVFVNGEELVVGEYEFLNDKLTVNFPLETGDVIVAKYQRSIDDAYAADRFFDFYEPQPGQPNQIQQVFTGIDFGGVELQGPLFNFNTEISQNVEVQNPVSSTYTLDAIPENTQSVSVFLQKAGSPYKLPLKDNVLIGDGSNNIADLSGLLENISVNDLVIKFSIDNTIANTFDNEGANANSLADGEIAYFLDAEAFKIKIGGVWLSEINVDPGDSLIFVYSAITNEPIDTILKSIAFDYSDPNNLIENVSGDSLQTLVDGLGFNSAEYIPSPEENVPGQVLDSSSIKVFNSLDQNNPENGPFYSFEIHKDNQNRYRFNRAVRSDIVLAEDFELTDQIITLNTTSGLFDPNKLSNQPGVININGERVEYFVKTSTTLEQLRRASAGTPAKESHPAGSAVIDVSDGEKLVYSEDQSYVAIETTQELLYNALQAVATQSVSFAVQTVPSIIYGNSTVKDWFEVFVNGRRLRKAPADIYNLQTNTVVSTPAEFSATLNSGVVTVEFTTDLPAGSFVTIVGQYQYLPDELSSSNKFECDFLRLPTASFIQERESSEI